MCYIVQWSPDMRSQEAKTDLISGVTLYPMSLDTCSTVESRFNDIIFVYFGLNKILYLVGYKTLLDNTTVDIGYKNVLRCTTFDRPIRR